VARLRLPKFVYGNFFIRQALAEIQHAALRIFKNMKEVIFPTFHSLPLKDKL